MWLLHPVGAWLALLIHLTLVLVVSHAYFSETVSKELYSKPRALVHGTIYGNNNIYVLYADPTRGVEVIDVTHNVNYTMSFTYYGAADNFLKQFHCMRIPCMFHSMTASYTASHSTIHLVAKLR